MTPKFSNIDLELLCPGCGGNYLHHRKVEVFSREEDAATGLKVTVEHLSMSTDTTLEGNPSRRRDGLKVYFDCEFCDAKPVLRLYQHKGFSYLEMDSDD
ncbi:hypothetical protein [Aeromonas sp. EERV15]|uniref:hypothetical protein n=1 Tax=Aeromonas sp. EERV15 TaxID=1833892 RepID=UPI001146F9B8|nr:hypothetical protein [Aeromonas sp. EERV15]